MRLGRPARSRGWLALAAVLLGLSAAPAAAAEPIRLKIVGGLAGISQYRQFEEPFWTKRLEEMSGGRLTAAVHPFDRSGLRAQDMLQLMKLGVVPFGTALLALVAGDEPELNVIDLPGLNPNFEVLRETVAAYRPHLRDVLKDRYGIELLGVYAYPAQVVYCAKSFRGLSDLAGRRVRTSSVSQSELVSALGGVPVLVPFAETVSAVSTGVVDCAITGTLSGYEIGLPEVTTHIHAMALSWGLSFFGANRSAWEALPADLRDVLRAGIARLEQDIWTSADRDTARGLACNAGTTACDGRQGRMTLVPVTPEDEARRRRLLVEAVLPSWLDRCGTDCAAVWNEHMAERAGIRLKAE
ncbi:TRAP transporter substrate-binding protein [Salinarimonas soli]|uniref:TRAP transporter substrate-binding protein n=1 Tax=Salinarimonas soli TaxID=1638099 RepID=A0A5B2VBQ6_9HYPH|nr:TRAP transporter substrate-binding protein [Salinarimonas soli]KAA2236105.1 TRAP transporter substrate-binding protein [Salinarimonas soli]